MPDAGRREFIRTIILGSGALFTSWNDLRSNGAHAIAPSVHAGRHQHGHALLRDRSLRFPTFTGPPESHDVVIVGGGVSGMAAAWELARQGVDVLLLEHESAIGGACAPPIAAGAGRMPPGATYFYNARGSIAEFLRDLSLVPHETGEDALIRDETGPIADWWNPRVLASPTMPVRDRDALMRFRDVLLALPTTSYPLRTAPHDLIGKYDGMSAAAYCRDARCDVLTTLVDLFCRSVLGAPATEVSAYAFINFYSMEFGDAFDLPCWTLPGGLGAVGAAVSTLLGTRVVTHATVTSVTNIKGGTLVDYHDGASGVMHRVHAQRTIVTVPKPIAAHIVGDLPREQLAAMRAVRYAPYVTIVAVTSGQIVQAGAFDYWLARGANRCTDVMDLGPCESKTGGRQSRHAYLLFCPCPPQQRASLESDSWLAAFGQDAVHELSWMCPDIAERAVELHVSAWGHAMVVPEVNAIRRLAHSIGRPHGNIAFANADNDLAPSFENAFEQGVRAARQEHAAR